MKIVRSTKDRLTCYDQLCNLLNGLKPKNKELFTSAALCDKLGWEHARLNKQVERKNLERYKMYYNGRLLFGHPEVIKQAREKAERGEL